MNKTRIIMGLVFSFLLVLLCVLPIKDVNAYSCPAGTYCETDGGSLGEGDWVYYSFSPSTFERICRSASNADKYICEGDNSNCTEEDTKIFYYSEEDCVNDVNQHETHCCNKIPANCPNCTPGPAPLCPQGTTETKTGDLHSTQEECCDNGTGCPDDCNTRKCYCSLCTPSCSNSGYSDVNLGQGSVPQELNPSCRNGNSLTPDRTTLCDKVRATCYCNSCLKECPSPLTNTGNSSLILNNFRECTNDCNVKPLESEDDCYEVESPQPTENLNILVGNNPANHYGFFSNSHTGDWIKGKTYLGHLNDPLNPPITMEAQYTDVNGASDIEGLFVWFRTDKYTGEITSPVMLSEGIPRTQSNDSWGFMLRRNGNEWEPYVPSYYVAEQPLPPNDTLPFDPVVEFESFVLGDTIQPSIQFWVKDIYSTDLGYRVFSISGPNTYQMVEVTILNKPVESGNTVSMEFSLKFSDNNGNLLYDPVAEGLYNIYLMGLDKFSFTPYDNYDIDYENYWSKGFLYDDSTKQEDFSPFWGKDVLRYKSNLGQLYARNWSYSNKSWTIDRTSPTLSTNLSISNNSITLSWNASDDRGLYAIVGNIFTPDSRNKTIQVSTSTSDVSLHNPSTFIINSESYGVDESKIGILNNMSTSLFQVNPDINLKSKSGSIEIDIGDAEGSLSFYFTVFDQAGNIFQTSEIKQDLNDWMVTSGGLAYSEGGTSFTTKNLADNTWTNILPPSGYGNNPGLLSNNANVTSEMWSESSELLSSLAPHSPLNSYSVNNFTNFKIGKDYYSILLDLYQGNKKNLESNLWEKSNLGNLSGAVSDYCSKEYCVFKYTGNLISSENFTCDKKTLLFVEGNLTINPPLKNSVGTDALSPSNGCIFIVNGNIYIQQGTNASSSSFMYDKVNGYLFANGKIIIKDEIGKRGQADPLIDGVYINGGLQSSYAEDKSISFERYLRLEDRLKFPLLAIDLHPKYIMLGNTFFGSKYIIQIVESGIKP